MIMYIGSLVDGSEESGNGIDEESNVNYFIENLIWKFFVDRIFLGLREIIVYW